MKRRTTDEGEGDEPALAKKTKKAKSKKHEVEEEDEGERETAVAKKTKVKSMKEAVEEEDAAEGEEPAVVKKTKKAKSKKQQVEEEEPEGSVKKKAKKEKRSKAALEDEDDEESAVATKRIKAMETEEEEPKLKGEEQRTAPGAEVEESERASSETSKPSASEKGIVLFCGEAKASATEAAEKVDHWAHRDRVLEEQGRTVFVGGIPWNCTLETLRKDFEECGEIGHIRVPPNAEGVLKGICFITYKTQEGVGAALKFDGEEYGGRTLQVNVARERPAGGKGKGKAKAGGRGFASGTAESQETGRGREDRGEADKLTVVLKGIPRDAPEDVLRQDFADFGEIVRFSMSGRGTVFIQYAAEEALQKALAFNETEYGGVWIKVERLGAKGTGKGKDEGKGKAKGKGKGKDKGKDKSKGAYEQAGSAEKPANSKVKTFDSDDED